MGPRSWTANTEQRRLVLETQDGTTLTYSTAESKAIAEEVTAAATKLAEIRRKEKRAEAKRKRAEEARQKREAERKVAGEKLQAGLLKVAEDRDAAIKAFEEGLAAKSDDKDSDEVWAKLQSELHKAQKAAAADREAEELRKKLHERRLKLDGNMAAVQGIVAVQGVAKQLMKPKSKPELEPEPKPEPDPEPDGDKTAQEEAIEYFCGLSFVHETDDGPSDETNLLAMREKYAAGELAGSTLVWTEDFDDWTPLEKVLEEVWADGVDGEEEEEDKEEEEIP